MTEPTAFPTAAQLAKTKSEVEAAVRMVVQRMNLRVKSIELAAQFPASDPIKLAGEIFAFITEGGEDF